MFITFEGPEGSGKTTQIKRLSKHLREQLNFEVVVTREPGGCPVADQVRAVLLSEESGTLDPVTELLLFNAARREHVKEVIAPALEKGLIVLCDRYTGSTEAYQAYGRGLDHDMVRSLNRIGSSEHRPDLVLFLDIDVEAGLERAHQRNTGSSTDEGRFDQEALEFHKKVYQGYQSLALRESGMRWHRIDAGLDEDVVAEQIRKTVVEALAKRISWAGTETG